MSVLTELDRVRVWERIMRENRDTWGGVTRQQIKAAVDALDAWLEANKSGANAALPEPARSELTTTQKAQLLAFVIDRRYLSGA